MGEARRGLGSILEGSGGARLEKLTLHGLRASMGVLGLSLGYKPSRMRALFL